MGRVFLDLEQMPGLALSIKSLLAARRFRGVWLDSSALDNVIVLRHQIGICAGSREIQLYQMFDI